MTDSKTLKYIDGSKFWKQEVLIYEIITNHSKVWDFFPLFYGIWIYDNTVDLLLELSEYGPIA